MADSCQVLHPNPGDDLEAAMQKADELHQALNDSPNDAGLVKLYEGSVNDAHGILMRALADDNPRLARLLALDRRVGRFVAKAMFFTPGARLARHELDVARKAVNIFTRSGHSEDNVGAAAIEPILQMTQIKMFKDLSRLRGLYAANRKHLEDITDDEFFTMAGFVAGDGDLEIQRQVQRAEDGSDFAIFEKLNGNKPAQELVKQAAEIHNEFNGEMLKMGAGNGAFTLTQIHKSNQRAIYEIGSDNPYVTRLVNRTLAMNNKGRFMEKLRLGLEQKRDQWLDEDDSGTSRMGREKDKFRKAIDETGEQIEEWRAADKESGREDYKYDIEQYEARKKHYEGALKELDELEDQLLGRLDDLVHEISGGYLGDTGNPLGTGASASAIKARILKIDDHHLESFMIRDVRMLMQHHVRSLVPDLVISRRMQIYMNGRDLSTETETQLSELHKRVHDAIRENKHISDDDFYAIASIGDDIKANAAYMNLVDYVRLIKDHQALAKDVLGKVEDQQRKPVNMEPEQVAAIDRALEGLEKADDAIAEGVYTYDMLKLRKAQRRIEEIEAEQLEAVEQYHKDMTHARYSRAAFYSMSPGEVSSQIGANIKEDGTLRDDGFYYILDDDNGIARQRLPSSAKQVKGDSAGFAFRNSEGAQVTLTDLSGVNALLPQVGGGVGVVRVPKDAIDLLVPEQTVDPQTGALQIRTKQWEIRIHKSLRRKAQKKPKKPAYDPQTAKELKSLRGEARSLERGKKPARRPVESDIWSRLEKDPAKAQEQLQQHLYKMLDHRKRAQKELRESERIIREAEELRSTDIDYAKDLAVEQIKNSKGHKIGNANRALAQAWAAHKAGTLDLDSDLGQVIDSLSDYFTAKDEAQHSRDALRQNAVQFHAIAQKVRNQNRATIGQPIEQLGFRTTRMNVTRVGDTKTDGEALSNALESMVDEVSNRRLASYHHNLDTLQITRAMEREADYRVEQGDMTQAQAHRLLYGRDPVSGQADPRAPRRGSAVNDLNTIHQRLRMRHGRSEDSWRYVGKAVRDLNFTRAMGSVLISSLPDTAMAIGQVGMWNYMTTLARFMRREFTVAGQDPSGRSDMAILMWAMETTVGMERTRTQYGVDFTSSDPGTAAGSRAQKIAKGSDALVNRFAQLTFIDKWNGLNKGIAAMAIQHRSADISVRLYRGEPVKDYELARVLGAGYRLEDLKKFGEQIAESGESEVGPLGGTFWYAKSATWKDRNLAEIWDSGVLKQVNDTIVTPGAGDLPTIATESELGRMLFQFRNFSIAVTQRMIIPSIQRFFRHGDPSIAVQAVMMWTMGMTVFAINEFLKGRDPFDDIESRDGVTRGAWRRWVLEGLDRSGVLGILTEINSSLERFGVPGLASLLGAPAASRFSSRGPIESILGPALGTVFDAGAAVAGMTDMNITRGEGALLRRMIPFQNLHATRLVLDVAPNVFDGGGYYKGWKPVQDRVFGFGE